MLRYISVFLFLITISTFAQDITNTLGASGNFKLQNSVSNNLLQIASDGATTINGATNITGAVTITGSVSITNGASQYTLPAADGSTNQVLTTNGSGAASWVDNKKLSVMFIICVKNEQFPSENDQITGPFIGEIKMVAGTTAPYKIPKNFMACEGQILNFSSSPEYQALFALIGNKYGGDGVSTFALPDFRNTMPISNP